jgi:hypothetical protein
VQVAAPVTPSRRHTGPTVLHQHGKAHAGASAASLGGDIAGTHQIPVPLETTVQTTKQAARRLKNPPMADRAGGGAAALIHQPHRDAGPLGLVLQDLHKMGAAPLPQPKVLHPTDIPLGDALGITHQQAPDPMADGELDDLLGGLMLGLMDAATMPRLHPA